jgi:hypothetical protein
MHRIFFFLPEFVQYLITFNQGPEPFEFIVIGYDTGFQKTK